MKLLLKFSIALGGHLWSFSRLWKLKEFFPEEQKKKSLLRFRGCPWKNRFILSSWSEDRSDSRQLLIGLDPPEFNSEWIHILGWMRWVGTIESWKGSLKDSFGDQMRTWLRRVLSSSRGNSACMHLCEVRWSQAQGCFSTAVKTQTALGWAPAAR